MVLIGCLMVVSMVGLIKETSGDTYTVGDSIGWTLPPAGNIAYSTWSRTKSFDIGDVVGKFTNYYVKIITKFCFISVFLNENNLLHHNLLYL